MLNEDLLSSPGWILIIIGVTVFLTFSCLGKKKKKVVLEKTPKEKVLSNSNNSRHQSNESEIDEQKADMADGYAMVNLNNVKVLEEKNTNNDSNAHRTSSDSNSPKGRSLPPPPEKKSRDEEDTMHESSDMTENESNLYASVDEENEKKKIIRSDDSVFYAKVGKSGDDSEEDPYSKVKDCNENINHGVQSKPPEVPPPNPVKTLQPAQVDDPGPEYASIDKVTKKSAPNDPSDANRKESASAPPVPERNFLLDEDDDVTDEVSQARRVSRDVIHVDPSPPMNHRHQHAMMLGQIRGQQHQQDEEGPTYDQLCVRESLDHMRMRQEVEEERKTRYANIQQGKDAQQGKEENFVYAQIDGDVEEAVYESVHVADENIQPLDGRIAQRNYDNARNEYSEIGASVAM